MVRPGMINLDFADVETVMSSMGKAMMGTGEADGENRAMVATEMALNNPLIDEYSLQGAKGLLVNITGGSDIKLFEVDQAVNKIRAEVDPEAELIFGAIKDENMNGKMRVSIVATALDGQKPESKTVLNMVNRIQNRNNGYSEGLFSQNNKIDNNTFNSIDGATALKLDEKFEINEQEERSTINNIEPNIAEPRSQVNADDTTADSIIPNGVSIESASYIESNANESSFNDEEGLNLDDSENNLEEYTPKLFSDENQTNVSNDQIEMNEDHTEKLDFEQDSNEEEDFEIPAFLRKQEF
jgi:cell division protein FtsZ